MAQGDETVVYDTIESKSPRFPQNTIVIVTAGNTDVRVVVENHLHEKKIASIAADASMRSIHERLLGFSSFNFNEDLSIPMAGRDKAVCHDGSLAGRDGSSDGDGFFMLDPPLLDLAKVRDLVSELLSRKQEYTPVLVVVLDTIRDPEKAAGFLRDVAKREPIAAGEVLAAYFAQRLNLPHGPVEWKEGAKPIRNCAYYLHYLRDDEDFAGNSGREYPMNRKVAERLRIFVKNLFDEFDPSDNAILYLQGGGVGPVKEYLRDVIALYYPSHFRCVSLSEGRAWDSDMFNYPVTPSASLTARKRAIEYVMKGNFPAARLAAESVDCEEERKWTQPVKVLTNYFSGLEVPAEACSNFPKLKKAASCRLRSLNIALRLESLLEIGAYPEVFILLFSFAEAASCDVWELKYDSFVDQFRNEIIFYGHDSRGGLIGKMDPWTYVLNIPYGFRNNFPLLTMGNDLVYRSGGKGTLYIETALYSMFTAEAVNSCLSPEKEVVGRILSKLEEKFDRISLRDIRNALAHGKIGEGQIEKAANRFAVEFAQNGSFLRHWLIEDFFSTGVIKDEIDGKRIIDLYEGMKKESRDHILNCDVL